MDSPFLDIQIVVAVAANGAIGKGGIIPWNYPEDMAFFKKLTINHSVVMGRKTFLSLGRALPNRWNFVVAQSLPPDSPAEVILCSSFEDAFRSARMHGPIFAIGGTQIYVEALKFANTVWITRIPEIVKNADAFFPELPKEFELEESFNLSEKLVVEKWVNPILVTKAIKYTKV